jgi:hypothetical protein
MSVEIEITGTGALVRAAGAKMVRPARRGQRVTVDQETAEKLIRDSTARYPDAAQEEQDATTSLDDMTVEELRSYASEHDINLHGATTKADIRAAIDAAQEEQE